MFTLWMTKLKFKNCDEKIKWIVNEKTNNKKSWENVLFGNADNLDKFKSTETIKLICDAL